MMLYTEDLFLADSLSIYIYIYIGFNGINYHLSDHLGLSNIQGLLSFFLYIYIFLMWVMINTSFSVNAFPLSFPIIMMREIINTITYILMKLYIQHAWSKLEDDNRQVGVPSMDEKAVKNDMDIYGTTTLGSVVGNIQK